jgi:hypothetical protein
MGADVILKTCACGRSLDEAHVLSHLVGIQYGVGGVALILFDCVCRSTLAIYRATAPDAVREASFRFQESADLFEALG